MTTLIITTVTITRLTATTITTTPIATTTITTPKSRSITTHRQPLDDLALEVVGEDPERAGGGRAARLGIGLSPAPPAGVLHPYRGLRAGPVEGGNIHEGEGGAGMGEE